MNELQKLNYLSCITQAIDLLTKAKEFKEPFNNIDKALLKIRNAHSIAVNYGINRAE
jgi:hypothetical protein